MAPLGPVSETSAVPLGAKRVENTPSMATRGKVQSDGEHAQRKLRLTFFMVWPLDGSRDTHHRIVRKGRERGPFVENAARRDRSRRFLKGYGTTGEEFLLSGSIAAGPAGCIRLCDISRAS